MTREAKESQLHDRIDELVRELGEANRLLAEANQTVAAVRREAQRVHNAAATISRLVGEAERRPRVAPLSPSDEAIEYGFLDAEIGRPRR